MDIAPSNPDGAEDSVYMGQTPPYRTANRYITSTSELLALPGFGRDRYKRLAPYLSALPYGTQLNVCTADPVVLDAFGPPGVNQYSADVEQFAKNRAAGRRLLPDHGDVPARAWLPRASRRSRAPRRCSGGVQGGGTAVEPALRHHLAATSGSPASSLLAVRNSTCTVFCTRTARARCARSSAASRPIEARTAFSDAIDETPRQMMTRSHHG